MPKSKLLVALILLLCGCIEQSIDPGLLKESRNNAQLAQEGYIRCEHYVHAWLDQADERTGLIPRNLNRDRNIWNAQDAAADNYPFMVLTAALTDQKLFEGRMLDMLKIETELTSRIGSLPDTWSFTTADFVLDVPKPDWIIFGSSEYIKDGLLPLTEWLGPSPWSDRMIDMLDDIWKIASFETPFGFIPSDNMEVNGEMLQVLSRVYWMTGNQKYLDWAIRLGDYYLLDEHHPSRDFTRLKLRDHGCEIISGLCELYATLSFVNPSKKVSYQIGIHQLLNRILEVGRNTDGLFYNAVNPQNAAVLDDRLSDNFGYNLNGFYTVYLVDGTPAYKKAVNTCLSNLYASYQNHCWEGSVGTGSADGYADAIEGALNLYNREPIESAKAWIDSEMQVMWSKQQDNGIIEGWHGDGNFARTTLMYCLWKTQGIRIQPWRRDVKLGAVEGNQEIVFTIECDSAWKGNILFDQVRHQTHFNLPIDWPRINQFPEWFIVEDKAEYGLIWNNKRKRISGQQAAEGIRIELEAGEHEFLIKKL